MLPLETVNAKGDDDDDDDDDSTENRSSTPFPITPWQQPLNVPKCAQAGTLKNDLGSPAPGNYPGHRFGMRPGGPADPGAGFNNVAHGIAPEFDLDHPSHCTDWNLYSDDTHVKEYKLITEEVTQEIIPG